MDIKIDTNMQSQLDAIRNQNKLAKSSNSTSSTSGAKSEFADSLGSAIDKVNTLQKVADQKSEDLATGKTQSLHDTMVAVEKADIALRLMVQVRNKMIDAYQEVMKMQV
ncbi:MAG: flagellar hook-basal body complex protein FliE [Bdellovibrionales bacterium]